MTEYDGLIIGIASILALCSLIKPVAGYFRIPFTVLLAGLGLLLGFAIHWASISPTGELPSFVTLFFAELNRIPLSSETFLKIFLPVLLFEAAITLNIRSLLSEWTAIFIMAVVAVILTTIGGGLALLMLGLDQIILCFLIAAIVATTDPVAVVAIFRETGVSDRLTALVEGESLLNDAAAIAIFAILLDFLLLQEALHIASSSLHFVWSFGGGALLGVFLGWLGSVFLDRLDQSGPAEVTLSVALAYLSFAIGENYAGVSGVVSVVAAGLTFGNLGRKQISSRHWTTFNVVWRQIGFWASSMIVVLAVMLAPEILLTFDVTDLILLGGLIAGTLLARAAVLFVILPFVGKLRPGAQFPKPLRLIALWGGLRGAVTLALALSVLEHPAVSHETGILVAKLATAFVLFTLLVQGTTLRGLVRFLGLDRLSMADTLMQRRAQTLARADIQPQMDSEAAMFGTHWRKDPAVDPKPDDQLPEDDAIKLALTVTSAREIELILDARAERLMARIVARKLVNDASLLRDAGRADGVRGYRREVKRQLDLNWFARFLISLHRRWNIDQPLAWYLSQRFEWLIVRKGILNQLDWFLTQRIDAVLGPSIAETTRGVIEQRKRNIQHNLDGIRLQYPVFWQGLTKRHLNRVSHRLRYGFYQRLARDGLLSGQLWRALGGQVVAANRDHQKIPRLDINLDPMAMMKKTSFFAHLDDRRLSKLVPLLYPILVLPGEMLMRRGERGDVMYFIESGAVEVQTERQTIHLGSGTVIGELAMLTRRPRTADVEVLTYSRLLCLHRETFRKFLAENPDLLANVRTIAKTRLKEELFDQSRDD